MITTANFGAYVDTPKQPNWYIAERYEYCESLYETSKRFSLTAFMERLREAFK